MLSFFYQLWDALFRSLGLSQKQGNLLLLGLDNAGKTTLLHRLRTGSLPQPFPPTDRPSQNEFAYGKIQFQAWDMGGHEVVRHLWSEYLDSSDGGRRKLAILFVVDASDVERLEEAGYELDNLLIHNIKDNGEEDNNDFDMSNGSLEDPDDLATNEDNNKDTNELNHLPPVAILLNKCDLVDQALPTVEVCQRIDYPMLSQQYPSDRLAVFRISVLKGEGYQEAFQWISTFL